MRKILTLLCVFAVMLTFAGCRKSKIENTMFSYVNSGEETVSVIENIISNSSVVIHSVEDVTSKDENTSSDNFLNSSNGASTSSKEETVSSTVSNSSDLEENDTTSNSKIDVSSKNDVTSSTNSTENSSKDDVVTSSKNENTSSNVSSENTNTNKEETTSSDNSSANTSSNEANNESTSSEDENIYDVILTDAEMEYKPTSLTVTLYDSLNFIYGFTFNTTKEPIKPVVEVKKQGSKEWKEYPLKFEKSITFNSDWSILEQYVSKAEIKLDADSTYIYRVCDKGAQSKFGKYIGTNEATIKTKNTKSNSFTFAHISDTQRGPLQFGNVLSAVTDKMDFLLHTGDIIQNPIESDWNDMIDGNFDYLSRIPMMAISGNHEVNAGFKNSDTYRHFNNSIPTQNSTASGYFYSYIYGDTKFIMLNTNDLKNNKLTDEQYNWLINELKANSCKWIIVSLHNPLYSVGEWGTLNNTIALGLQEQLKGIFAEYGVDIVLQGHDHTISRTLPINAEGMPQKEKVQKSNGIEYTLNPKGVIYLTNGTSGSVTREPEENYDKTLYKYACGSKEATWSEITVNDNELTVVVKYYYNGKEKVYYKWGIKKTS